MALQIWLPLNGDIHNQGLINLNSLTPSQNTMTFNRYQNNGTIVGGLAAAAIKELYTTSLKIVSGNPVARGLSEL